MISILGGVSNVEIIGDVKCLEKTGKPFVSRTVSNCSVHLNLAGFINPTVELNKCQDKMKKLKGNLEKLKTVTNAPSYKTSAPLHIQEAHLKKANTLQEEINQLENYAIMIRNLINE